ncbi:MAG: cobyrinate a,c-diamide synthase [Cyanobium sp.]|uniref:cobyrinate a,c-diamide synthase n=1 Tax=Synechococcus sp. CS-1333 TaxID=2848638 RepID=UPI000DBBCE74|nr:cobyrinate a,c-diamide synthase [Synechococcus sp. CS-1333]MCT0209882.1 cobyrinate a,c-diamide synthase [Synechococcus sp. CS-1333]PZV22896.1 MAG: cobyrinate a,c-diamide synthase [Cyanobium sp.]
MACLIAAPCSGSGKTLLSLALTALLRQRGRSVQTFKVGPDYLDPQLLARVSGRPCRNLDRLLCGPEWVERSFHWWGRQADHCLVEGVMGLFDGRGPGDEGSSAELAVALQLPVVLVVEASRQAGSVAALVNGFRHHRRDLTMAGVVLNGVSTARHQALLSEALAAIGMPVLGLLPRHPSLSLPSRHLGLLPAHELHDLTRTCGEWAALAEQHLDLAQLLPLLAPPASSPETASGGDPIQWALGLEHETPAPEPVRVAIAADAAFHFRYPEATELLEAVGVEPRLWQPLADAPLPPDCQGVILPGGYPELHAPELAAARHSLADLRRAAAAGLPIYAECGGLLLLGQALEDPEGQPYPMAGLLPFTARRGALQLGYRQATPRHDGLVARYGESVCGHEFHRWELHPTPTAASVSGGNGVMDGIKPLWQLEGWGCPPRSEGWTTRTLHASWLHLHWAGCSAICRRLHDAARRTAPFAVAAAAAAAPAPWPPGSAGS